MRHVSCFLIVVAGLVLGSCTFQRLAYNYADQLLLHRIDSLLDLNQEQKRLIKPQVQSAVAWVKQQKLREVILLVRELEQAASKRSIDAAMVDRVYERFNTWRTEITERVSEPTAQLLKTLDPDQVQHLQKRLAKGYQPLEKLLKSEPKDLAAALDEMVDKRSQSLAFWYGDFTPDQRHIVRSTIVHDPEAIDQQLTTRKQTHQYFLNEVQRRDVPGIRDLIIAWDRNEGQERPDGLQRQMSRERWRSFWIVLHQNLNEEQWLHLQNKLREVAQDLEGYAADNAAA